jgi:hypothetical protein
VSHQASPWAGCTVDDFLLGLDSELCIKLAGCFVAIIYEFRETRTLLYLLIVETWILPANEVKGRVLKLPSQHSCVSTTSHRF